MGKYIWISKSDISPGSLTYEFTEDGVEFEIDLPASDTPEGIEGDFIKESGDFVIRFKYLEDEPEVKSCDDIDGIKFYEGANSGHLTRIIVPVEKSDISYIGVQTKTVPNSRRKRKSSRINQKRREREFAEAMEQRYKKTLQLLQEAITKRQDSLPRELKNVGRSLNLNVAKEVIESEEVEKLINNVLTYH
ncbi:hypothetical protein [Gimesia panareensis]|uniref:Uncharacterized protein n=1 Tax=Gimesia panareensis TaxID=2527978 RepID=A0A517QCS6_9PLAN|nr:hypothetical protein [Gimesia panareensis]QDT29395.1 hypothetical protein Enr10x_47480 [Gimesia panareensis]QDU52438.1 hypothetical protein Pan110_48160 [Gimesia panareensis]